MRAHLEHMCTSMVEQGIECSRTERHGQAARAGALRGGPMLGSSSSGAQGEACGGPGCGPRAFGGPKCGPLHHGRMRHTRETRASSSAPSNET